MMKADWIEIELENLLDYVQPTKFIVASTDYSDHFKTPVLTPGKSFIIGYTNETEGIFSDLPTIIFDDFTTASKYVNFPFKVKSSAMKILAPTSEFVNLKYLYYGMQVINVRSDTHKRYWISIYSKIKIPLAPLPEQRAIVSKIEQLFSELDHGVASLRAAKAQLAVYRQAVLKKAFEGELTRAWRERNGIRSEFKIVKIEDIIADLTQGWSPKCLNEPSTDITEWAVIKTSAIQYGQFLEIENKILPKTLEPRSQHEIQKGDVLITRAGPRVRVGVCCLVKSVRPRLINCDKVYRLRLKKDVNNEFFEYRMTSLEFIHKIEEIKTGGNDSGVNLTQNRFLNLELSIPVLEEQTQIVQEIESRLSVCDNILANIDEGLEKAEALRQSILKKAFEGKLLSAAELADCRKEADWEPAEALLARIRKERPD